MRDELLGREVRDQRVVARGELVGVAVEFPDRCVHGCVSFQVGRSSCAASEITRSSRAGGPTSCTPTGVPSLVSYSGTEIAGCPVTFHSRTKALKRTPSSVTPALD